MIIFMSSRSAFLAGSGFCPFLIQFLICTTANLSGILLLGAVLLFPISSVYGHGLGIETISSVDIQGKKLSITIELPLSFDNMDEKQITITATEDETKENAKNVT